ncbi:MAG TPA: hypothetical protein VHT25_02895 [Solirubrobacteraceae bacterium]|nr:hypothetical protein [Solirubrobacteraceae bacterium]
MAFDTQDPTYQDLLARVLESDARVVPSWAPVSARTASRRSAFRFGMNSSIA